jgi:hypothetical protein
LSRPRIPRRRLDDAAFPELCRFGSELRWLALVPRWRMRLRAYLASPELLRAMTTLAFCSGAPAAGTSLVDPDQTSAHPPPDR